MKANETPEREAGCPTAACSSLDTLIEQFLPHCLPEALGKSESWKEEQIRTLLYEREELDRRVFELIQWKENLRKMVLMLEDSPKSLLGHLQMWAEDHAC